MRSTQIHTIPNPLIHLPHAPMLFPQNVKRGLTFVQFLFFEGFPLFAHYYCLIKQGFQGFHLT